MKSLFAFLLLFSLPALAAEGDLLYVSDVFYVPVRATGCNNCTIVHRGLVSGTQVTDLGEQQDGWTRIRTPNGIEGWMPDQFLLTEPAARERLPQLEEDMAALRAENGQLEAQLNGLLRDMDTLGLSVETLAAEGGEGAEGQPVTRISGDIIALNSQNQELLRRNQLLQRELDLLVAENERLADMAWRTWFIYGGLAVFAGAVLSALVTRLKKRRGFSEWA